MNRLARRATHASIFLALLLAGCGGGEALSVGGGTDAGPVRVATSAASAGGASLPAAGVDAPGSNGAAASPSEAACEAQAYAQCALRDECTVGFANLVEYGSASACVAQRTRACVLALQSPDTGNSIGHVQTCADSYASESCTEWWDDNPVTTCRSPAGTRKDREACGVNSQCASAFCDVPVGSTCGTCASSPEPGDACDSVVNCGYDLACPIVAPATTGVCTVRAPLGGECDGYRPCEGELSCVGAHTSERAAGVCEHGATLEGTACNTESGPGCDEELGLYCSGGACQRPSIARAGQPCGDEDGVEVICEGGAACITAAGSARGICAAVAAEGEACDRVAGPPCLAPTTCVTTGEGATTGTCVFPDPSTCGGVPDAPPMTSREP